MFNQNSTDTARKSSTFLDLAMKIILARFNPSGGCLAAERWQSKKTGKGGFSFICSNKWKPGCTLKGSPGACDTCTHKNPVPVNVDILRKHLEGNGQFGIYPALPGGMVHFVVCDVDGHRPGQNAAADVRAIMVAAADMGVSIMVFLSQSGTGYHVYLFFSEPTPYNKARGLLQAILDRCQGMTAIDCIKPSSSDAGTGGGLIALPFSGEAFKLRGSTIPLDENLNPVADTLEDSVDWFDREVDAITPERLNELITEHGIKVDAITITSTACASRGHAGELEGIFQCRFMQEQFRDGAGTLPEPLWYDGVSNLCREPGGVSLTHEICKSHPGYTRAETDAKILQALNASGPTGCAKIKEHGGICGGCTLDVTAPVALINPWAAKREGEPTTAPMAPLTPTETQVCTRLKSEPPAAEFVMTCRGYPFLRKGIVSLIVASGGTGKTFFMLRLAAMMAKGTRWGCFEAEKPLKVLFLGAEDDQNELDRRLWAIGNGFFHENLHAASVVGKIGTLMKLDGANPIRSEWFEWLRATIKAHMPLDALMLDPISRIYGLNENDNSHATSFVKALESLSIEFDINIAASHHANKMSVGQSKVNQGMIRGASGFVDGARHAIGLIDVSADDIAKYSIEDPQQYFKMDTAKANNSAKMTAPVFFKKNQDTGIPEYVNLHTDKIAGMAEGFYQAFVEYGQIVTEKKLLRGEPKELFDLVKGNVNRITISKDIKPILSHLAESGALIQTAVEKNGKVSRTYAADWAKDA